MGNSAHMLTMKCLLGKRPSCHSHACYVETFHLLKDFSKPVTTQCDQSTAATSPSRTVVGLSDCRHLFMVLLTSDTVALLIWVCITGAVADCSLENCVYWGLLFISYYRVVARKAPTEIWKKVLRKGLKNTLRVVHLPSQPRYRSDGIWQATFTKSPLCNPKHSKDLLLSSLQHS